MERANRANPSFERVQTQKSLVSAFPTLSSYQPRPEAVSEKGSPRSAVDPDVALAAIGFFPGGCELIGSHGTGGFGIFTYMNG